jgi:hypothetical protein
MSSDEEDIIAMWWFMNRKKRRAHWVYPYIKRSFNRTVFITAKELSHDDRKFQSFYRTSKDILAEVVSTAVTKKDTNWRQCVGVEKRLFITLR